MNQHKDEEWVDQLISQAIDSGEPQFDPEKWKQKYPEEFQMIASRARQGAGGPSGCQASVWKTAMQSRITRLALPAAVLIVLAVLGFWRGRGVTGVAYGMSEARESLRGAATVHIKGWLTLPPAPKSGHEQKRAPFEIWMDLRSGQMRINRPSYETRGGKTTVLQMETVYDGEYLMQVSHSGKSVTFLKRAREEQQPLTRQSFDEELKGILGDPAQVDAYRPIDRETIAGKQYDVWEAELPGRFGGDETLRIRSWLSSTAGEIGRVRISRKTATGDWAIVSEIQDIERDVEIAESTFATEPPKGYTLRNKKDTAPAFNLTSSKFYGTDMAVVVYMGFALPDGSVVLAWSSTDKGAEGGWEMGEEAADISQADLFEPLEAGGPLPKLPIQIHALRGRSLWRRKGTTYTGRHLAYTQKDNKLYEWAIYVPPAKADPRAAGLGFDALFRFNPAGREVDWNYKLGAGVGIVVTRDNFETYLLSAMGQLSDEDAAPEHVTYDSVLELSDRIRKSLSAAD